MLTTDRLTSVVLRARNVSDIEEEAAIVLNEIGLTVSDALRLLMVRKQLPFTPLAPNTETMEAMKTARRTLYRHRNVRRPRTRRISISDPPQYLIPDSKKDFNEHRT